MLLSALHLSVAVLIQVVFVVRQCGAAPAPFDASVLQHHLREPLETTVEDDNDFQLSSNRQHQYSLSIPSRYESTILGRRLLALSTTGVLATVFPADLSSQPRVPHDVSSVPIALPDYIASCEEPSGNPTILALKVSTATKNAVAGSNVSLSVSWWDEYRQLVGREAWSRANLPRLSVLGYLEEMTAETVRERSVEECFTAVHPDSRLWLPGRKGAAHEGLWMRLVVMEVYWIGGFGDRNFIGWFDVDEWKKVTVKDWGQVRLPGEK